MLWCFLIQRGWPTCLRLGSTRKFLITRDRPVGNEVTSTKCHKMQRFSCKRICVSHTFTTEGRIFMFRLIWYFTISQQCFLENWLKNVLFRFLVNSMQNQARATNWDSVIDLLVTAVIQYCQLHACKSKRITNKLSLSFSVCNFTALSAM